MRCSCRCLQAWTRPAAGHVLQVSACIQWTPCRPNHAAPSSNGAWASIHTPMHKPPTPPVKKRVSDVSSSASRVAQSYCIYCAQLLHDCTYRTKLLVILHMLHSHCISCIEQCDLISRMQPWPPGKGALRECDHCKVPNFQAKLKVAHSTRRTSYVQLEGPMVHTSFVRRVLRGPAEHHPTCDSIPGIC